MLLMEPGCMKKESFPVTPYIEFRGFSSLFDTGFYAKKGILTIYFTDGDGDLGYGDDDTYPPFDSTGAYYYNFVVDLFGMKNGVFEHVSTAMPLSSRIPKLTTETNKAIKGTINDTIPLFPLSYDTIRFDVYITDRALHKSNIISTPPIILKKQK